MSTIKVEMRARQQVEISKIVDMDRADFDEYNEIIDSGMSSHEIDKEVAKLAEKYGLDVEPPCGWDDMEDVTFEVVHRTK